MRNLRFNVICSAMIAVLYVPAMVGAQTERTQDPSRIQEPVRTPSPGDEQMLTTFLAGKIYLANHLEVKLGEMATQKANHSEVKQLAQTIVQEHKQLNQKLKPFLTSEAVEKIETLSGSDASLRTSDDLNDPTSGQRKENQAAVQNERNQQAQNQRNQQVKQDPRNQQDKTNAGHAQHAGPDSFMQRLCDIQHEAAKNHMQMCTEMFQRHQGQDFDMAFLGMQIGSHTWMVAELEACEGVGSDDFQSIIKLALQSSRDHLEKSKQLAQQLQDNENVNSRTSDREDDRNNDDDGDR